MGMPYGGIEDLRPETLELLRIFAMGHAEEAGR